MKNKLIYFIHELKKKKKSGYARGSEYSHILKLNTSKLSAGAWTIMYF